MGVNSYTNRHLCKNAGSILLLITEKSLWYSLSLMLNLALLNVSDSCSCGCHERLKVGSQIAADIREGLFKELGITCCGGIAHNKLLSKLVAGAHKPNQQTTLFPESTSALMASLNSVRNIPGMKITIYKNLKRYTMQIHYSSQS